MAVIPVTIPDAAIPRAAEAVGVGLGLRNAQGQQRNATNSEVQGFLASYLNSYVHSYEAGKAANAAAAAVTDVGAS